ncbi:NAD(P)-dependent alcohol dehydrogenase [Demequina sp. NBRC 110053]|uniref:NAD(P)-dependent alcohol dehydrogenase n=1 Tax=Demequina sp. NBRC 110053 TaxID=1570342 RepID=UPI0009FC904A|nr:NAD(P)-dependent alcohol dehydrogenase [Demequina sp. NBRC 110053]
MRAVAYHRYGSNEDLRVLDVPTVEPGPGDLLIRVAAAGLNAYDWHQYRGEPLILRASEGWRVREPRILGADLAGTVEAVGTDVTGWATGDRVMAEIGTGACAEWAVASADAVARIPDDVSFESAAATPMAGLTALQALRDTAALVGGEDVLVWGASGGVGHTAVQVARALGARRVAAVCSSRNRELVERLGADRVFAYDEAERPDGTYDVVIDTVATAALRDLRALLSQGGRVVTVGAVAGGRLLGPGGPLVRRQIGGRLTGVDHGMMLAKVVQSDLAQLADWLADGSLTPVVQETYPLDRAAQACRVLEDGHVAGKLVIAVGD